MSDFVRWNDAESKFVPTTADDPKRVLIKADQSSGMGFFGWLLAAIGGAIVGDIVITKIKEK